MIFILAALIGSAQTDVERWTRVDGLKAVELMIAGDTVRIKNGVNGQVLARIGGKWINWTPDFPQLVEFSDTLAIIATHKMVGDSAAKVRSEIPTLLTQLDSTGIRLTESQISNLKTYVQLDSVVLNIDFKDLSVFYYTVPFDMTLSTQESEHNNATIDPILGTSLTKFQTVTVTPDTTGLIILSGAR